MPSKIDWQHKDRPRSGRPKETTTRSTGHQRARSLPAYVMINQWV